MRYLGTSVLRSAPGAVTTGLGEPASVTSRTGHGFGFLTQNFKKSNAYSPGSTTRLACANPEASPPVGSAYSFSRMRARTSCTSIPRTSSCCAIRFTTFPFLILTVHSISRARVLPRLVPQEGSGTRPGIGCQYKVLYLRRPSSSDADDD